MLFADQAQEYRQVTVQLHLAIQEFDQALSDQTRALVIGPEFPEKLLTESQKFRKPAENNTFGIYSSGCCHRIGKLSDSSAVTWTDASGAPFGGCMLCRN